MFEFTDPRLPLRFVRHGATASITDVDSLDHSLVFYPQAFLTKPVHWTNDQSWRSYHSSDCARVAVLRSDISTDEDWKKRYVPVATFRPGWIEQALVKANPKNARRGPLIAYAPAACPAP